MAVRADLNILKRHNIKAKGHSHVFAAVDVDLRAVDV
jgi:hypothetical protein